MLESEIIEVGADQRTRNKREIIEISVYGISILIFCLGLLFNYAYAAQSLTIGGDFEPAFWNPLASVGAFANLFNSVLIILNIYHNFCYRNHFEKLKMPNQEILYLICLPFLIFTLVGLSIVFLREVLAQEKASLGKELFAASSIIFFLAILSLLIEANMFQDTGEEWKVTLSNIATIILTIITLVNNLIYPLSVDQVAIFVNALNTTNPNKTGGVANNELNQFFDFLLPITNKVVVIFDISCAFFLINPLLIHFRHLQKSKKCLKSDVEATYNVEPYKISSGSLLLSFMFIITISVTILYDSMAIKSLELINLLIVSTYIVSFVHIYFVLLDLQKCQRKEYVNSIHYILIWLGLFGQFIQSISGIHVAIRLTIIGNPIENYWTRILQYVTQVIECFAQNICVFFIIERKWQHFDKSSRISFLSCPLFLVCTNIGFMFLSFYLLYSHEIPFASEIFFVRLFETGFNHLGMIFSVLHRAHGAIVFIYYFKYYLINSPAEYCCNL